VAALNAYSLTVKAAGHVGVVVSSCYPPGAVQAVASLQNAHIDGNKGGGAAFLGNMTLTISGSTFNGNTAFGVLLVGVTKALVSNTSASNTVLHGAFHLWGKTYDDIADGFIAGFNSTAFVTNSQFVGNARAAIIFDSSGGKVATTTSSGGRFGFVVMGSPKPDYSDPQNSFIGSEQAILADGDLGVPAAPPIPE
jgi:hypothetical protein